MNNENEDEKICFNMIREGVPLFICSECHKSSFAIDEKSGEFAWGADYKHINPKYFPHCGTKVLDE